MRQLHTTLAALGLLAGVVACSDPLGVQNRSTPDTRRVYARPSDAEALVADQFNKIHSGTLGTNATIHPQMLVMGLESYSALANFCMGPRGAWPRDPINNQRGNPCAVEQARAWNDLNIAARSSANGLVASRVAGFSLGGSQSNLRRMQAFAFFNMGVALGNIALAYERGPMISELDELSTIGSAAEFNEKLTLVRYDTLMAFALTRLDSALAYASSTTDPIAALPSTWINGSAYSPAEFARIIRSYRARFRAGVARNLTERQAVDWDAVIADATAGIQADVKVTTNATSWVVAWPAQQFASANWSQVPTPIIGMADTSGAYLNWVQTPVNNRPQILIKTPDLRFPSGETRTEQIANSPATPSATTGFPYFRNRPAGNDSPGEAWAVSMYDNYKYAGFVNATSIGQYILMPKAEIDMLAAEGHIRKGNLAAAATLIDVYRTRAGLPPTSGTPAAASLSNPVPGGSACVPRIPTGASFNTVTCGNLYEAMKWEYRMETGMNGWGQWYFAGRGWNDLPVGTATSYPVPFQELDTRLLPIYNLGGVGQPGGATASTYGFGVVN
jgi:hypothetical protein